MEQEERRRVLGRGKRGGQAVTERVCVPHWGMGYVRTVGQREPPAPDITNWVYLVNNGDWKELVV